MAEERQDASTDNQENQTNVRLSDEEKSNLIKFYEDNKVLWNAEGFKVKINNKKSDRKRI